MPSRPTGDPGSDQSPGQAGPAGSPGWWCASQPRRTPPSPVHRLHVSLQALRRSTPGQGHRGQDALTSGNTGQQQPWADRGLRASQLSLPCGAEQGAAEGHREGALWEEEETSFRLLRDAQPQQPTPVPALLAHMAVQSPPHPLSRNPPDCHRPPITRST